MSESKRVIRVKDLVIEADNVIVRHQRRHDPIFGGFRREEQEHEHNESPSMEHVLESENRDEEDSDRRPFSWI